jgi:SNF2 family DNA or RNA helicase
MTVLWQHQKQIVNHANKRKRSVIYAGMGTGKTLAALKWLEQFDGPCLVLTPKAALPVWAEDAQRFKTGKALLTLDKGNANHKANIVSQCDGGNVVIVVNYETARLLPLEQIEWSAVVADECQKLGTHNSKQTIALTRKLAHVPNKLAMTGTLWHDSPQKLYSIMRFLYPQVDPNPRKHPYTRTWGTYNEYLNRFAYTYEISRGVYGITGWRNLRQIASDVKRFVLSIRADDVLDLPPVVERTHKAKLRGQAADAYKQLRKDRIAQVGDLTALAPHELTKLTRLAQLAANATLVADDGQEHMLNGLNDRLAIFDELVSSLGGKPCVVFTRFNNDVKLLEERLETVSYLTGERNSLSEWQGGKTQTLLANINAGSAGVRLERAAHIIFWSVGYSAEQYAQAVARCRRAGQIAKTIYVNHIVSEKTIDEMIYRLLARKGKTQAELDRMTI